LRVKTKQAFAVYSITFGKLGGGKDERIEYVTGMGLYVILYVLFVYSKINRTFASVKRIVQVNLSVYNYETPCS
jgi:hypothetical protein